MSKISTTNSKPSYPVIKPEWVRVPEAVKVSGLSRSSIYELIASGKIKSFSNRARGSQRGIRLISYDSLLGFLEDAYLASLESAAGTHSS
ncbi:MAG: DNA-binding protein [Verrucomicrobia bacterium]|nr:DNA-binding protein [Verrucomicrobiota bacterium]